MVEVKFGAVSEAAKPFPRDLAGPKYEEPTAETKVLATEEVAQMIADNKKEVDVTENSLNLMVMGTDNTGKSGIVQDYLCTLKKKSIVIDLDGHNKKLLEKYHPDEYMSEKIVVLQPFIKSLSEDKETRDVKIDYIKLLNIVKATIMYVNEHKEEYSALVLDGVSELLKDCENQMRIEKHITPDGGVDQRYWKNRADKFREVIESMRSIPNIDKIFITHEDFIIEGKAAMIKAYTNQRMAQRIICRRVERRGTDNKLTVEFVAKINKSKYNIALEGKEVVFGKIESGKFEWDTSKIFEGF